MQITKNSLDTATGPSDWFTGTVYIDAIAAPSEPSRVQAASVHFTPGARTAWHIHPFGQTIYVTEGIGLCQRRGGRIELIRPGDRVFFEPSEDHWHGCRTEPLHDPPRDARSRRRGQPRDLGRARDRRGVQRRTGVVAAGRAAAQTAYDTISRRHEVKVRPRPRVEPQARGTGPSTGARDGGSPRTPPPACTRRSRGRVLRAPGVRPQPG
jgi:quercetin dioxygenase-like cupin family protein